MSAPLFLVSPEDSLWTVYQQMQRHRVRRLVVAGLQGELLGIVTQTSLLQMLDPIEMCSLLEVLQQKVRQLEAEKVELLPGRRLELEQQAELELPPKEQLLQFILDNAQAVIYAKDAQGRYLLINHRFESLFHVNREEIKGKTDYDIFSPEIADAFSANDRQILEDRIPHEWEEVAPHEDGLHTYLSVKFPLYNSAGVPYGVGGISTDITERKQAEVALQKTNLLLGTISSIQSPSFGRRRPSDFVRRAPP